MRIIAVVLALGARAASSQTSDVAIQSWRSGLEISVNGSPWDRALTVGLTKVQCPPSSTSPCAAGSAVAVDVRFPPIEIATDLSRAHAQIGEAAGPMGNRYEVRLVRELSSPLCADGFGTSSAYGNTRIAINVGAPGPRLPITCRWVALVGIPATSGSGHVAAVWSDTVVLQLTSKP